MSRQESDKALAESIEKRRHDIAEAMTLPPFAVLLGASNLPGDPLIWSTDWRQQLPEGHIDRVAAEDAGELPVSWDKEIELTRQAHLTLSASARRLGLAG